MKRCKILLCLILCVLMLTSCAMIPVELLMPEAVPTAVPALPSPSPIVKGPVTGIAYTMEVKSEAGTELILSEPSAAIALLEASQEEDLRVKDAGCTFTHKLYVYNENGSLVREFALANDGCLHAQDNEGNVFLVPQYVWSLIDTALWEQLDALWNEPWVWNAQDAGTAALEIRLPYLLNTILAHRIGYAQGYFSSYRIYEVKLSEKQAQIYLLGIHSAYIEDGDSFRSIHEEGLPIRLTLDEIADNTWRLSGYRQADFSQGIKKESVRAIFSYENTTLAMADLADLTPYLEPMQMQVRSFMLTHGLSHLQPEH